MENKGTILMHKYEIGRLLGQGTFAKVYYARGLRSNESVAIKVIDKDKVLRVGLMDQIKREISVMRLVKHPNVVHFYEVMASKGKIYFVMEYVRGGELFDKVAEGKFPEDVARRYFQQLIGAVDFCHSRGVYHRDLKPENLLLDENGNLKVSDFGLSALTDSKHQDGLLHTTCGTPAYVAPEVINRKGYDGAKSDVWSCGVILFVLLAGYLPFNDSNLMELYRKIGKGEFKCPKWFSREIRRLLVRILDPNPSTRISIAKIKENSWYKIKPRESMIPPNTDFEDCCSSSSSSSSDVVKANGELSKPTNMNAFDLVSHTPGFDLSGLFEGKCMKREAVFTLKQPAETIISKLEDIGRRIRMKVTKREGGLLKFVGYKEGRKGILSIDVEIFEVAPCFHLVEVKKCNGDTLEFEKIVEEDIRPALKDIVWDYGNEQQQQPQELPPPPPPLPQQQEQ